MFASLLIALTAAAGSPAAPALHAGADVAPAGHAQVLPVRQKRPRAEDDDEPLQEARPAHPIVSGSTAGMAAMASGVGIAGIGGVVGMVVGAVAGGGCCVFAMCSSGCATTWGGMGMASGVGVLALTVVLALATFVSGPVMGLAGWAAAGIGRPRPSPWPLAVVGWAGTTLTAVLTLIVGVVPAGVGAVFAYQVYRDEQITPFAARAGAVSPGEERFLQRVLPLVSAGLLSAVVVAVLGLGATATLVGVVAALGIGTPTAEERAAAAAAEAEQRSSGRKPRAARKPRRAPPQPTEEVEDVPSPSPPPPPPPVEPAAPPPPQDDVILPDQGPAAPTPDPAPPAGDPY